MTAKLSREENLLLAACRIEPDSATAERLDALLDQAPDWESILRWAETGGVLPLLCKHLGRLARAHLVPPEIMARLREAYHLQSIRNLRLLGQAARIVDAFKEADLPAIVLKGAFLAGSLYRDTALRPMGDIDLLCRAEDEAKLRETLLALGFLQEPTEAKSPVHDRISQEESNHLPRFINAQGLPVEIHVQLFSGLSRPEENLAAVWRTAQIVEWNGRTATALSPEDLLAHLVIHFHHHLAKSGSITLYWLCDIDALVRTAAPTFDWGRFCERLDSLGAREAAEVVLSLLQEHWGTPVPHAARSILRRRTVPLCVSSLLQGKCAGPELLLQTRAGRIRRLAGTRGKRAVLTYIFRTAWPSRDFIVSHFGLAGPLLVYPCKVWYASRISSRWVRTALAGAFRGFPGNDRRP